jgi:hypothetical protein
MTTVLKALNVGIGIEWGNLSTKLTLNHGRIDSNFDYNNGLKGLKSWRFDEQYIRGRGGEEKDSN